LALTSNDKSGRQQSDAESKSWIRPATDIIDARRPNEFVGAARSEDNERDDDTEEEEDMADSANEL
jgi:hypothetical protein